MFKDNPNHDALESGDSTFVRLMTHRPANDNRKLPMIVGLMGYGGSGKSETAKAIVAAGYVRMHIKKPLVEAAATLLREAGISEEMIVRYLDGDLKRQTIPEFRRSGTEIQQFLGTEFGRDFCYPALWLDIWASKAKAANAAGVRVIQESVRFPNEAAMIRSIGGLILRVDRAGVGPLSDHPSERLPAEPDIVISNNGSLTDLRLQVMERLALAA